MLAEQALKAAVTLRALNLSTDRTVIRETPPHTDPVSGYEDHAA